ncbi:MAG: type II toxin-antitoxin system CcdA family antitoxin [Solirubrobacteraceae bacterium]|nr:type II toxin-antitoxin system CcdA family antitoxin [Patulibacter sp.]
MTMVKKTVTLDADVVEKAARASGGNFSAYVNEALAQRLRREGLAALVELDIKLRGPIDDADVEATLKSIDAVWDE